MYETEIDTVFIKDVLDENEELDLFQVEEEEYVTNRISEDLDVLYRLLKEENNLTPAIFENLTFTSLLDLLVYIYKYSDEKPDLKCSTKVERFLKEYEYEIYVNYNLFINIFKQVPFEVRLFSFSEYVSFCIKHSFTG